MRKKQNRRTKQDKHERKVKRGYEQLAEDRRMKDFDNDWNLDWFSPRGQQIFIEDSFLERTFTIVDAASGCVDKDTEFLSDKGWKKIDKYCQGDLVMQCNNKLEASFTEPLHYIKLPCSKMYHFSSERGIDQMLCEDHNIAYWIKSSNQLNKIKVKDLIERNNDFKYGGTRLIPKFYKYNSGFSLNLSEDELKLGVALKADGHLANESTGRYTIRLKKERKIDRLKNLLDKMKYEYSSHKEESTGFTIFKLYAKWCSKSYFDWFGCSVQDARIILNEFEHWDGSIGSGNRLVRYGCTVKEDADAFQYFANVCGFKADILIQDRVGQTYKDSKYVRKSKEYVVQVSVQVMNTILPLNTEGDKSYPKEVETQDGFKYCFTVPDGYLVLRRNGKVFVTGNCGKTATSLWLALKALKHGDFSKLVFLKNPTEVGDDNIGYLSGSESDKLKAHLQTTRYIFHEFISSSKLEADENAGRIRLSIPNFLLGATLDYSVVLIDEAQLMSPPTMKLLLERCGVGTKYIIMGDSRQRYSVKKREDGFREFIERVTYLDNGQRFSKYDHVGYVRMTTDENQRSEGSKFITKLYEGDL